MQPTPPVIPVEHVAPFLCTLSRMAGLFIFAPIIGSRLIPARVRALLALTMTAAVYPFAPTHAEPIRLDLVSLAPVMATETLIGLSIGLIAALPIICVQMGGQLMSQQMGLHTGDLFNPAIELGGDIVGQILMYLALAAFVSMDGLEAMHASLVATFERVPIGGFRPEQTPLDLFVALVVSGTELAFRVAAPVTALMLLESLAMGFLMKTSPQFNILSFGFPVKILLGVMALLASLAFIATAISIDVEHTIVSIMRWAGA